MSDLDIEELIRDYINTESTINEIVEKIKAMKKGKSIDRIIPKTRTFHHVSESEASESEASNSESRESEASKSEAHERETPEDKNNDEAADERDSRMFAEACTGAGMGAMIGCALGALVGLLFKRAIYYQ